MIRSAVRAGRTAVFGTVLVLTACTAVAPGSGPTGVDGAATGAAPVPVISEEPAEWAIAKLNPCVLLAGVGIPGAEGAPFLYRPHGCQLDHPLPDKPLARTSVDVGTAFGTSDRARSAPTTIGGLVAYQEHDAEDRPSSLSDCVVDIPLSASRSIRVMSTSHGGELDAACVGARAVAEQIAAKLATPAELARSGSPTGPGSWPACRLLETALGAVLEEQEVTTSSPHADECRATLPDAGPGAGNTTGIRRGPSSVTIETEAGPSTLIEPRDESDIIVQLPAGPALQRRPDSTWCTITYIAERRPDAPRGYTAQVTTVSHHESRDPCADAVATATAVQTTVATPAPPSPPAPDRLGFATGEPDDVMPVACGTYGGTTPESCRVPQPAVPPATAQAILDLSRSDSREADANCAILSAAAEPVAGPLELAAVLTNGSCVAVGDGYAATLAFYDASPAGRYCSGGGLEPITVRVAGRDGIRCHTGANADLLILPATGTTRDAVGVVLVDGELRPPRGHRIGLPPEDLPRVRDLTMRIAENVINRYLSS